MEGLLGIELRDGAVTLNPCVPPAWGGLEAILRRPTGSIAIRLEDPDHLGKGRMELTAGGASLQGAEITFPTDGSRLEVVCRLSAGPAKRRGPVT